MLGEVFSKCYVLSQVAKVDKRGRTGLHLAAMRGHYHLVALLMGQGAELGAKDRVSS